MNGLISLKESNRLVASILRKDLNLIMLVSLLAMISFITNTRTHLVLMSKPLLIRH